MKNMGTKKGKDKGSFVAETMEQVIYFYGEVLQDIRGWTRPPAKLRDEQITVDEPDAPPIEAETEEAPSFGWVPPESPCTDTALKPDDGTDIEAISNGRRPYGNAHKS